MNLDNVIFVSGIDTDAGKTYATAALANLLRGRGMRVITMKFIQTGCDSESEDIVAHRRLMDMEMTADDKSGLTAPIILHYPASAQLAARLDGVTIDLSVIDEAVEKLAARYDVVLVEGAGGLMVPITDDFFAIDYARTRNIPIALVTNSCLGSINHTVLSLEAIKSRGIKLHSVIFNHHFDYDITIATDTREFVGRYVDTHFPHTTVIDIETLPI